MQTPNDGRNLSLSKNRFQNFSGFGAASPAVGGIAASPSQAGVPVGMPQRPSDMSAYAPGVAQSIAQFSPGTQYQTVGRMTSGGEVFANPANLGNYGNAPQSQRPQSFSMDMTGLGGRKVDSLEQMMNQRAAALAQIMDQGKLYKLAGATNQNIGAPQYDLNDIIGNANSMVESGWQNPLGNIAGFQGPPPEDFSAVEDLFAKNKVQTPPGFMDQLIRLLGASGRQAMATQRPSAPIAPDLRDKTVIAGQQAPGAFVAERPGAARPIPSPSMGMPYRRPAQREEQMMHSSGWPLPPAGLQYANSRPGRPAYY